MAPSPPLCGGEEDGDLEGVRQAGCEPSRVNMELPNTYFVCSALVSRASLFSVCLLVWLSEEPHVSGGDPSPWVQRSAFTAEAGDQASSWVEDDVGVLRTDGM